MGLDIEFVDHNAATADLDGTRLTTVPGFFNFVRVLGVALNRLNDPNHAQNIACHRACVRYAAKHPDAAERFQEYLAFAGELAEFPGVRVDFSVSPADYDPLASNFSTALMLRGDPVDAEEAGQALPLTTFIGGFASSLPLFRDASLDPEQVEWMAEVLEKLNRCLKVAAEKNLAFRIDF